MRPLRLEPFTFVVALVMIFGISPITTCFGQAFTPQNPNFDWSALVAISGGLILILSLALGTALDKRSHARTEGPEPTPRHTS